MFGYCLAGLEFTMDKVSAKQRSENMRRIRQRNTAPEIQVRRSLHSMGFRFRLHRRDLPGKPDIVLPRHRVAIFVHGCFWHLHDCRDGRIPKSNVDFWTKKLTRNCERDEQHLADLTRLGWDPIVVWECETEDESKLKELLRKALHAYCD